ncbi:MAG: lysophospholipid acyltransferase family protein [Terracidiphilus sp.]|jgi:1-acyl-sn-glycerol-3-phosphate acyltransferase
MTLRKCRRAVALAFALALCVVRFWLAHLRGHMTLERRAQWSQSSGRLVLAALGIRYRVEGQPPSHGLVVANHLSYLDILILSAAMPCFFVAKAEIDRWPFFGKVCRSNGTIFIDRSSLASAEKVTAIIAERLTLPVPVLFFPEGTSTNGSSLLRFHSRLFEPAAVGGAPVTAAAISYVIEDGTPERELCWFGDDAFLPHLWKALGTAGFSAEVQFGEPRVYPDRRIAANETHAEVEAMRSGGVPALR